MKDLGFPAKMCLVSMLLGFLLSCAASPPGARESSRSNRPILTEDLDEGSFGNLHSALRELRPLWLRRINGVFADGVSVGGESWLRVTPPDRIERIDFLTCEEAMTQLSVSSCMTGRYIHVIYRR